MRRTPWLAVIAVALSACMPDGTSDGEPAPAGSADGPVRLGADEVAAAIEAAGCEPVDAPGDPAGQHVDEDGPTADELYATRPPTAGDHLGRWVEARIHEDTPDERAVVHNHEHGAVSVWFDPVRIDDAHRDTLTAWAEARNADLANDAGAGVVVAPYEGLAGTTVAFRAWTGGLDCERFDPVAADGFLLERFGDAPEGDLAPDLTGIVDATTTA